MANKKSTVRKVADAVTDAAAAVVHAADEHVVQPIGSALGLGRDKTPQTKSSLKGSRKLLVKSLTTKNKAERKSTYSKAAANEKSLIRPSKENHQRGSQGPRRGVSKGR